MAALAAPPTARRFNGLFLELLDDLSLTGRVHVLAQAILVTVNTIICFLPRKEWDKLHLQITTLLPWLPPADPGGPSSVRTFNRPIGTHEDDAVFFADDFLTLPPVRRLSEFIRHLLFILDTFPPERIFEDEDVILARHVLLYLSTRLHFSLQILQRSQPPPRPTPVCLADGHVFGPLTADATPRPSPSTITVSPFTVSTSAGDATSRGWPLTLHG